MSFSLFQNRRAKASQAPDVGALVVADVSSTEGRRFSNDQYVDLCLKVDAESEYRQALADKSREEEVRKTLPDVQPDQTGVPESTLYAYAAHRDIPRGVVEDVLRAYAPTAESQRELAQCSSPSTEVEASELAERLSTVCAQIGKSYRQNLMTTDYSRFEFCRGYVMNIEICARRPLWSTQKILNVLCVYKPDGTAPECQLHVHNPMAFELFGKSLDALVEEMPSQPAICRKYAILSNGSTKLL